MASNDRDTGLIRFGARDYDPTVGRWVNKDPLLCGGLQENLYCYVNNDPVNEIDMSGAFPGGAYGECMYDCLGSIIGGPTGMASQFLLGAGCTAISGGACSFMGGAALGGGDVNVSLRLRPRSPTGAGL